MSELQEGVQISEERKITGTLHRIEGYTGFSNTDNDGHFLALKVEYPESAEVSVTVIGGTTSNKKMPRGDHQLVTKIADATRQKIRFDIEKDGQSDSATYDLSGLVLEDAD